jgi:hypothetical protein
MPDEAPDRTVAAILQAVETAPQVRPPWRWLPLRSPNMNRLLIAAAAAAIVLAVGGGLLITRSNEPSIGGPSPSPSVSASPGAASPSAAVVPDELLHPWLGEVVEAPGLPSGRDRSILQFGPSTVELVSTPAGLLRSDIVMADSNVLELVLRNETAGCSAGAAGRYAWSISPGGSQLQVTRAANDECDARRVAFEGSWQRAACRDPNNLCLGDLDAGTYRSQFIGPRLDEGEPWTANFGAFMYTVPDGWANTYDYPDAYVLMPSDEYATASEPRDGTKNLIEVYARPAVAVQDATCAPLVKPDTGRSVADLIAHVTQHPGLTASEPQSITIDGHPGQFVDVEIAPSWTGGCPDLDEPLVILFTESGRDMTNSGIEQWGLWNTNKARLILLDLGDGDAVLIDVRAPSAAAFDGLLVEAMPIVESLRFE